MSVGAHKYAQSAQKWILFCII